MNPSIILEEKYKSISRTNTPSSICSASKIEEERNTKQSGKLKYQRNLWAS